jgi:hypothetical protein
MLKLGFCVLLALGLVSAAALAFGYAQWLVASYLAFQEGMTYWDTRSLCDAAVAPVWYRRNYREIIYYCAVEAVYPTPIWYDYYWYHYGHILTALVQAAIPCAIILWHVVYRRFRPVWSSCAEEATRIRGYLERMTVPTMVPPANHSHPNSRAQANAGVAMCNTAVGFHGKLAYMVQKSRQDVAFGRPGSIFPFWGKDYGVAPGDDVYDPSQHIKTYVDTDYYVDMPAALQEFEPKYLVTISPDTAASDGPEMSFSWYRDGDKHMLHSTFSGSATYTHQIWDYGKDTLTVLRTGTWARTFTYCMVFCITSVLWSTAVLSTSMALATIASLYAHWRYARDVFVYLVVRCRIGQSRYLIGLLPYGCGSAAHEPSGARLERLHPIDGDWVHMVRHTKDGISHSIAHVGSTSCITVTDKEYEAAKAAIETSSSRGSASHIQNVTSLDGEAAFLFLSFLRAGADRKTTPIFPLEAAVRRYQYPRDGKIDPLAGPSMKAFMRPIINEGFAPDECLNNDIRCIEERVIKPQARALPPYQESTQLLQAREAFLAQWRKHVTNCRIHPVEPEVVLAEARTSKQRAAIIDALADIGGKVVHTLRSFQKKEAYTTPNDPRNITQMAPSDRICLARFWKAFHNKLKDQEWYAFSKSPREIANAVVRLCIEYPEVFDNDGNRFDGSLCHHLRETELLVLLATFERQYGDEIRAAWEKDTKRRVRTKHGHVYNSLWSRLSGSNSTSDGNSLISAYLDFVGMYLGGMDADDAWRRLGIYGGDDALATTGNILRVAREVGMKYTSTPRDTGNPPCFLSRQYGPNVFKGDPSSMCDIRRTLGKFHLVSNLSDDPIKHLVEKARAYWLTDAKTPILGPFVCRVMELAEQTGRVSEGWRQERWSSDTSWWSTHLVGDQWPQEDPDWMEAYVDRALGGGVDFRAWNSWVAKCMSLEELLRPPTIDMEHDPPAPKGEAVLDGIRIARPGGTKVLHRLNQFLRSLPPASGKYHLYYVGAYGACVTEQLAAIAESDKVGKVTLCDPAFAKVAGPTMGPQYMAGLEAAAPGLSIALKLSAVKRKDIMACMAKGDTLAIFDDASTVESNKQDLDTIGKVKRANYQAALERYRGVWVPLSLKVPGCCILEASEGLCLGEVIARVRIWREATHEFQQLRCLNLPTDGPFMYEITDGEMALPKATNNVTATAVSGDAPGPSQPAAGPKGQAEPKPNQQAAARRGKESNRSPRRKGKNKADEGPGAVAPPRIPTPPPDGCLSVGTDVEKVQPEVFGGDASNST